MEILNKNVKRKDLKNGPQKGATEIHIAKEISRQNGYKKKENKRMD